MAVQLNLIFRLTWTGLEFKMTIPLWLSGNDLRLTLHASQKHGAKDLNLFVYALITPKIGMTLPVPCNVQTLLEVTFYSLVTTLLSKLHPPVLCNALRLPIPVVILPLRLTTRPNPHRKKQLTLSYLRTALGAMLWCNVLFRQNRCLL